jgi:hypothetical protein
MESQASQPLKSRFNSMDSLLTSTENSSASLRLSAASSVMLPGGAL